MVKSKTTKLKGIETVYINIYIIIVFELLALCWYSKESRLLFRNILH